ncbi:MAG TPA: cyclic nucleotide-binding domain-containing protein [Burkholderiales bacterium]|nr:cyclic nucleotide-binding domain-containing protein [Burkholderiales bacterium]
MSDVCKIAIIGSGPSGLSCAAHAAELGVSHVLLEAEGHPSDTIYRYQKGKHVMAEPAVLPLRSPIAFSAGKREAVLDRWNTDLRRYGVDIRLRARVTQIAGGQGAFVITTAQRERFEAENVVLCIGLQGNLRKLGVPGEELPLVQYELDDPDRYSNETIVVVGAGDAAIENALALADSNRVVMINRNDEFARAKQGNLDLVLEAIKQGRIECRYGTSVVGVEDVETDGKPCRFLAQTPAGVEPIACDRVIARLGAIPPRKLVESFGIEFPSADPAAVPRLSERYESNVPGLYIIGALGGYPLIKQAMNQGYEVVEYILGNRVEPADEPLLREKFRSWKGAASVSEALALIQRNVPLFAELTPLQLREFMLDSEVLAPRQGEAIFFKGDYSNSFFSVVEGEVLIETRGEDGGTNTVALGQGQFFGEMGLLSGRRRANTVRAGHGCVVVETPRRSMLKLIASIDPVRQEIDRAYLRRAVRGHVAPWISGEDMEEMIRGAVIKTFPAGATLFSEGDEADGLHLIRRGSVMITKQIGGKEIVLSYVPAGNYIGEMALLSDERRTATVRAAVNVETIVLQSNVFKSVVARNASLRGEFQAEVLERVAENVKRESEPEPGNLISFLLAQGIGEATDVLLIDESLCIRCDNCEKACADSHDGTSRLDRQAGPTFANIHVPTSCRHCENPHCMKDCPPDAIHRNPQGEVYIDDTCIGCGNCQKNCPYGVIQLATAHPKRHRPSLWAWLITGLTTEPGRERTAEGADKDGAKKAVKCDMCKDLWGGAACVRACPTGAAIRVSPEKFLDYAGN